MAKHADRPYDVVLFGATGFTGGLAAAYLARRRAGDGEPPTRLALAGRNVDKLRRVADRLGLDVPLLRADATDPASLHELAASARVVASTVGPFIRHGEPLVAACAAAGTDYVDITGEPEFVDLMYVRHHATAERSGARLVHCCGFDSVPHDLGAQFTVAQLPSDRPLHVRGYVRARGQVSGGTLTSALTIMGRWLAGMRVARERGRLERRPTDRHVRGEAVRPLHVGGEIGWALPLPTIDPQIVLRSARALPEYGPDFTYGHYAWIRRLPVAAGAAVAVPAVALAAQLGPARRLMAKAVAPGDGPSERRRARSWFKVRFHGATADGERRVVCEVGGGDPGYEETAKMLAESALCLAHDDGLPDVAGQTTTAVAMGPALRERLVRAGMRFEVLRT